MLRIDCFLQYCFLNESPSVARVRIYDGPDGRVALVTQLFGNRGASITNRVEIIAAGVRGKYGPCRYIEHYPAKNSNGPGTFAEVAIRDNKPPQWHYIQQVAAERILGEVPQRHTQANELHIHGR